MNLNVVTAPVRMRVTFACALLSSAALLTPVAISGHPAAPADAPAPDGWRALLDGKSLAGWKESDFFGAGRVTVANGIITLGSGALTGITWAGPALPFAPAVMKSKSRLPG